LFEFPLPFHLILSLLTIEVLHSFLQLQLPDSAQREAIRARRRENQRQSRARKREYLLELEKRLRLCELQGIEASTEIQSAARRVAEENRQLRELLHKHEISEEYIGHYLQARMRAPSLHPTLGAEIPPPSVQAMQQLLVPRRPTPVDPGQFPMTGQTSREASITGAGAGAGQKRGLYLGDVTPRMDAFSGQPRQTSVAAGMIGARHHGRHAHAQVQHQQQQHHHHHQFDPQQVQAAMYAGAVGYGTPIVGPYTPDIRKYGPGGGDYGRRDGEFLSSRCRVTL
jgi:hypothetical protein